MPSSADKDAKAKSSPRAASRASKPGAVSVSVDEAARLDERIAQKQRKATPGAATSRPGAVSTTGRPSDAAKAAAGGRPASRPGPGQPGVRRVHSGDKKPAPSAGPKNAPPQGLQNFDSDVRAKQQGKQSAGVVSRPGAFPGASGATGRPSGKPSTASSSAGRGELSQLERDVAAKNAARRSAPLRGPAPGARSGSNAAEDAVQQKARRAPVSGNKAGPAPTGPGGRAQLSAMEGSVVRKASGGPAAAGPGAVAVGTRGSGDNTRGNLSSLEDAVTSKVLANNSGRAPVNGRAPAPATVNGRAQLSQMESDVVVKRMASNPKASKGVARPAGRTQSNQTEANAESKKTAAATVRSTSISAGGGQPQVDAPAVAKKADGGGSAVVVQPMVDKTDGGDKNNIAQEQAPPKTVGAGGQGGDGSMEFGMNGVDESGLAIAVAIEEDEEDVFIPSAVEYDPDAKPPLHQNRRFRLYAFLAFFALLAATGGAVVGIVLTRDDETGDGIPYREKLGIRERVEKLVGQEELESSESPYAKAVEWIIHEDPMEVEPDEANFLQRYTMAYFYYATTAEGPWRSCNPPVGNEQDFCYFAKLVAVFPDYFENIPATRWLSSAHECQFAGVTCDDKMQVRQLDLSGQKLSGNFPAGLVHLPFLQSITFAWCGLSGPLPKEIIAMKHLVNIEMQYNMFSGPIPLEWWQSRNLVRINLAKNELTGTLPPEIKELKDIKGLFLQTNKFTGSIPTEIGELKSLTYVRLSRNSLEGPLPTEFGQLKRLEELWLHRNVLSGSLAPELGDMALMEDFRVHKNSLLVGDIPDSLYKLTSMLRLDLYECNFTGTISPLIANFKDLTTLRVGNNPLNGQLPSEIGKLELSILEFQNTNITGKLPDGLCELRGPQGLRDLIADCAADPVTGEVEFQCDCCSECCDAEGTCTPTADEWEE